MSSNKVATGVALAAVCLIGYMSGRHVAKVQFVERLKAAGVDLDNKKEKKK